jgi:arsenate reductase-like glutaredoxin family protein
MESLLFTFPNCTKCEELKKYLKEANLEVQENNLVLKESKMRIREFLNYLKRDDKGAILLPSLVIKENGEDPVVLNNRKELEEWLRSRA